MVEGVWEDAFRSRDPPDEVVDFVSVSSAFYPLADIYESRAAEWLGVNKKNPLAAEVVAGFRTARQRATEVRREVVAEYLRSHGYQQGMFEKYGARDMEIALSLLDAPSRSV